MALTHRKINTLKPTEECTNSNPDKYPHGDGLFLYVRKTGKKVWYSRYTDKDGKQPPPKKIGDYPVMNLQEAVKKNIEIKEMVANGIDPKAKAKQQANSPIFDEVANEWFNNVHKPHVKEGTFKRDFNQYQNHIKPQLGKYTLEQITKPMIINVGVQYEKATNATDMSKRAIAKIKQIFDYAINEKEYYSGANPANGANQSKQLKKHIKKHYPKIDIEKLPKLMQDINGYGGHKLVKMGLWFMAYTFLRTGNIRFLEWSEIDFDNQLVSISADKMKAGNEHTAPLSNQSIAILKEIKSLELSDTYVFFNLQKQQPYSENAFTIALNNLGYSGQMTGHGFRSVASTALNSMGFNRDAIECELAHTEQNQVRASYNHADYMSMRIDMVQKWADFVDNACYNDDITSIKPAMIGKSNPKELISELLSIYTKEQLIKAIEQF